MDLRNLLPLVILVLLAALPALAAPPGRELVRELDAFRHEAAERGADHDATWQPAADEASLTALLAPALGDSDALAGATLLACVLSCTGEDFVASLELATGSELDRGLVTMSFADDDGTVLTTLGDPGSLAVTFERDSYRLRRVEWRSPGRVAMSIAATGYRDQGWTLEQVSVTVGDPAHPRLVQELTRVE